LTSKFQGFVLDKRMDAERRSEVKLDEVPLAAIVLSKRVSVNSKALYYLIGTWDSTIGHSLYKHVRRFCIKELEVPEIIISGLSLWDFSI